MAWTSAALAQAEDTALACAADMAIRLKAAAQAVNFIDFIETLFGNPRIATLTSSPRARQAFGKGELSYPPFAFMKRERLLHVLNDMHRFGTFAFAFAALLAAGPASASPYDIPQGHAAWPTEHQKALRYAETQAQPYVMNYAEEAARNLGVKEGKWEAFTPSSSSMPSVKGSLDSGRPMLILQWRPGQ